MSREGQRSSGRLRDRQRVKKTVRMDETKIQPPETPEDIFIAALKSLKSAVVDPLLALNVLHVHISAYVALSSKDRQESADKKIAFPQPVIEAWRALANAVRSERLGDVGEPSTFDILLNLAVARLGQVHAALGEGMPPQMLVAEGGKGQGETKAVLMYRPADGVTIDAEKQVQLYIRLLTLYALWTMHQMFQQSGQRIHVHVVWFKYLSINIKNKLLWASHQLSLGNMFIEAMSLSRPDRVHRRRLVSKESPLESLVRCCPKLALAYCRSMTLSQMTGVADICSDVKRCPPAQFDHRIPLMVAAQSGRLDLLEPALAAFEEALARLSTEDDAVSLPDTFNPYIQKYATMSPMSRLTQPGYVTVKAIVSQMPLEGVSALLQNMVSIGFHPRANRVTEAKTQSMLLKSLNQIVLQSGYNDALHQLFKVYALELGQVVGRSMAIAGQSITHTGVTRAGESLDGDPAVIFADTDHIPFWKQLRLELEQSSAGGRRLLQSLLLSFRIARQQANTHSELHSFQGVGSAYTSDLTGFQTYFSRFGTQDARIELEEMGMPPLPTPLTFEAVKQWRSVDGEYNCPRLVLPPSEESQGLGHRFVLGLQHSMSHIKSFMNDAKSPYAEYDDRGHDLQRPHNVVPRAMLLSESKLGTRCVLHMHQQRDCSLMCGMGYEAHLHLFEVDRKDPLQAMLVPNVDGAEVKFRIPPASFMRSELPQVSFQAPEVGTGEGVNLAYLNLALDWCCDPKNGLVRVLEIPSAGTFLTLATARDSVLELKMQLFGRLFAVAVQRKMSIDHRLHPDVFAASIFGVNSEMEAWFSDVHPMQYRYIVENMRARMATDAKATLPTIVAEISSQIDFDLAQDLVDHSIDINQYVCGRKLISSYIYAYYAQSNTMRTYFMSGVKDILSTSFAKYVFKLNKWSGIKKMHTFLMQTDQKRLSMLELIRADEITCTFEVTDALALPVVRDAFIGALEQLPREKQELLLQFFTSVKAKPSSPHTKGGWRENDAQSRPTVHFHSRKRQLPSASTCLLKLNVPAHTEVAEMKASLLHVLNLIEEGGMSFGTM